MIRSKKGFTLVELMVVISIIAILAGALVAPVTEARRTARTVRCKTNLRNLAQAALSYAVDSPSHGTGVRRWGGRLPSAGTYEVEDAVNSEIRQFSVYLGWVSGYYAGSFPWPARGDPILGKTTEDKASYAFFGDSELPVYQSITNGAIWKLVGSDLSTYVCDEHKTVAKRAGCRNVLRSYVMNAYFGCNLRTTYASETASNPQDREWARRLDHLSEKGSAGALLLFAELPAYNAAGEESVRTDAGSADGILDVYIKGFNNPNTEEFIGFNHRLAKRMIAHVAFADGHVDAIIAPDNARDSDLRNLTALLCNGLDVSANKNDWENDHPKKTR